MRLSGVALVLSASMAIAQTAKVPEVDVFEGLPGRVGQPTAPSDVSVDGMTVADEQPRFEEGRRDLEGARALPLQEGRAVSSRGPSTIRS